MVNLISTQQGERANEWDYAAGHAIASKSGSVITTLEESLLYGKKTIKSKYLNIKVENLNA